MWVCGESQSTLLASPQSLSALSLKAWLPAEPGVHLSKRLTDWIGFKWRTPFLQIFPHKNNNLKEKKKKTRRRNIFLACLAIKEHTSRIIFLSSHKPVGRGDRSNRKERKRLERAGTLPAGIQMSNQHMKGPQPNESSRKCKLKTLLDITPSDTGSVAEHRGQQTVIHGPESRCTDVTLGNCDGVYSG